jgi:hypothetical protein
MVPVRFCSHRFENAPERYQTLGGIRTIQESAVVAQFVVRLPALRLSS